MGSEISLLVLQSQLCAEIMAVSRDRLFRDTEHPGNLLARLSLANQARNLDFHGGEMREPRCYVLQKGGQDLVEVGFKNIDMSSLVLIQVALLNLLKIGGDHLLHVGKDIFPKRLLIVYPFLQQDLQRDIRLFQLMGLFFQCGLSLSKC